jgi:SAM-dependent methyltransferase
MASSFRDGLVGTADYENAYSGPEFARLEAFSNSWRRTNESVLSAYSWWADPLNHWSRRWEYPFAWDRIASDAAARGPDRPYRLLDAGSGVTFFPSFLTTEIPGAEVTCCDYDPDYDAIYARLDQACPRPVRYSRADLRELPFPDASFEAIYCISVLEHTRDYPQILREFSRVLVPDGRLICTFDVSPDGHNEIDPDQALHLLASIRENFPVGGLSDSEFQAGLRDPDLWTTRSAYRRDRRLVPAHRRGLRVILGGLRRGRLWVLQRYSLLACCGLSARKGE